MTNIEERERERERKRGEIERGRKKVKKRAEIEKGEREKERERERNSRVETPTIHIQILKRPIQFRLMHLVIFFIFSRVVIFTNEFRMKRKLQETQVQFSLKIIYCRFKCTRHISRTRHYIIAHYKIIRVKF